MRWFLLGGAARASSDSQPFFAGLRRSFESRQRKKVTVTECGVVTSREPAHNSAGLLWGSRDAASWF